jgi:hypothetical protein
MGLGADAMDMRMAMGMAMDLGLAEEDDDDQMLTMTDDQMVSVDTALILCLPSFLPPSSFLPTLTLQLESIAIDGYLADLPLGTFVHNLPYHAGQATAQNTFSNDFTDGGDGAYSTEMDQHTTSALRDAIFSLNESSNTGVPGGDPGADGTDGTDQQGMDNIDQQALDPHLALLDLSHAMPVEDNQGGAEAELSLNNLGSTYQPPCAHVTLVPRVLALLSQHPLEPKPGSNTPLSMYIFTPIARSLRLFHSVVQCTHCCSSPQQTLPQLALLSRTTTVLTFPCPPPPPNAAGTPSAQLTVHGARLSGTGISEAIEQHIVGVVWDSWRASIREIFNAFERKAQEVIQQNAQIAAEQSGQVPPSSAETQRAGLMFQAMSRLVSAMNEVERD